MHRGFFLIWRKIEDSGLYQDANTLALFLWLIHHARISQGFVFIGRTQIALERGQIITGRRKLSVNLGQSEKQIRRGIETLKKGQQIDIKWTNKYSLITVLNYDSYQNIPKEKGQQKGQQIANGGPSEGHQRAIKGPQSIHENHENHETMEREKEYVAPAGAPGGSQGNGKPLKPDQEIPYEAILKDLSEVSGKSYRASTPSHRHMIAARWKEGFRLPDFLQVHRNMKGAVEDGSWSCGDPNKDMSFYLRPATLYKPSGFEGYLNWNQGRKQSESEKIREKWARIEAEEAAAKERTQ